MPLHVLRCLTASILLITGLLTACGGGGGDGGDSESNDKFSVSTNSIDFVAETPAVRISREEVTGTVKGDLSGTLYLLVHVTGSAVASVSDFTVDSATNSGTAFVYPADASTLGEGTHTATITVRACLNDSTCNTGRLSGSPKTIDVTYDIDSSVAEETVMPHVVKSGTSGEVVIRGFDFTADNVNNVTFNSIDATDVDVVSESEIHATYPALTADTYAVQLRSTSGVTDFSGNLVVTDAPAFTADTVSYSTASPQVLKLIYDAEREALLVAASYFDGNSFNTSSRQANEILRYQFSSDGSLVSTTSATIPLLQSMDLSPDGAELIAVADRKVLHLNPSTLAEIKSTGVDASVSSRQYLKDVAVMNDGNALITTGFDGSGHTPAYIYPISQANLLETSHPQIYHGSLAGSANGSYAAVIKGFLSPLPTVSDYVASTGIFSETSINANQVQCRGFRMSECVHPAVDPTGQRFAVIDISETVKIYNRSYTLLGKLPITTRTVAFNSDGSSLYALDGSILREYDLTATTDQDDNFPEVGSGTAISSPGSGPVRMILSADGGTLFIAGRGQIVIQPAP